MEITFDFPVTAEERARLATTFGCSADDLEDRLSAYGRAALREYINGFLGTWTATRAGDLKEYRLLALILEVVQGIPDEEDVARHFAETPSRARGLIRSVLSKYPHDVGELLRAELARVLESFEQKQEDGLYEAVIHNSTIVDELNRRLAQLDGRLTSVARKRSSVSVYQATVSTYEALCADLGVQVKRYGDE